MRFDFLPARIEEAQFKQVPEGWLFTLGNPWIFARRRTYLISNDVKPALAARMRRARYVRLLLIVAMLAAIFAVPRRLVLDPSVLSLLLFVGLVVIMAAATAINDQLHARPYLDGLVPSRQRITFTDMLVRQSETLSTTVLVIFILLGLFAFAGQAYELASGSRRTISVLAASVYGIMLLVFATMLVIKVRRRSRTEVE